MMAEKTLEEAEEYVKTLRGMPISLNYKNPRLE